MIFKIYLGINIVLFLAEAIFFLIKPISIRKFFKSSVMTLFFGTFLMIYSFFNTYIRTLVREEITGAIVALEKAGKLK